MEIQKEIFIRSSYLSIFFSTMILEFLSRIEKKKKINSTIFVMKIEKIFLVSFIYLLSIILKFQFKGKRLMK